MKQKGFEDAEISSFTFKADEVEPIDPEDAVPEAESSFIFYPDERE
jgi:hypothetical protein